MSIARAVDDRKQMKEVLKTNQRHQEPRISTDCWTMHGIHHSKSIPKGTPANIEKATIAAIVIA
jgi:hypothetical protein